MIDIVITHRIDPETLLSLEWICGGTRSAFRTLTERIDTMSIDTARIAAAVERQRQQTDALLALVASTAQQVRDLSAQLASEPAVQAELDRLAERLESDDAVVDAQTSPAPAPVPEEPTTPEQPVDEIPTPEQPSTPVDEAPVPDVPDQPVEPEADQPSAADGELPT